MDRRASRVAVIVGCNLSMGEGRREGVAYLYSWATNANERFKIRVVG